MEIFISDISKHLDKQVTIKGWVYNLRSSGKIAFLQIRDGSGFVQAIVSHPDVSEKIWEDTKRITLETSVIVTGTITKHPRQEVYELQLKDLNIVQISEEYPIGKKEHGPDFLLDLRHLWLRSRKQWAIQRVRNAIINATYEWMGKNGFIKIDSISGRRIFLNRASSILRLRSCPTAACSISALRSVRKKAKRAATSLNSG